MTRVLSFAFLFFVATASSSFAETITRTVHGKTMTLEKIVSPHGGVDYKITSEQSIPLAFGNQIILKDAELDFHPNSDQISLLTIYQPSTVQWSLPTGESIALNCGRHYANQRPRLVSLYDNGQIKLGCEVGGDALLPTIGGDLVFVTSTSGSIDFSKDGFIKYIEKASSPNFQVHNQNVALASNREIAYHENGLPYFFTISQDAVLYYNSKHFGELQLSSPPTRLLSTLFSEQGQLVASYIKNSFEIDSPFFSTLKAGAGPVAFSEENEKPFQISLTVPQKVVIGPQNISVKLHGRLDFYENSQDYKIKLARLSQPQELLFRGQTFTVINSIGFFEEGQELEGFITSSVIPVQINQNHDQTQEVLVSGPVGFFPNGNYRFLQIENKNIVLKIKRGSSFTDINAEKGDQILLDEQGSIIRLIPHQILDGSR